MNTFILKYITRTVFSKQFLTHMKEHYPYLNCNDFSDYFERRLLHYERCNLISIEDYSNWVISDTENLNLNAHYRAKRIDERYLY